MGSVEKDGLNNAFASFRVGRLKTGKDLNNLIDSKLKSSRAEVTYKISKIDVK